MCKHLAISTVVSAKRPEFARNQVDSSAYWVFMMVKYEKKLAEYHERERPKMPQNWNKITLQEAKDSLRNLKS